MSDHTITACCLNMEALLREAVGLLPAEPDWKVRVIAELNRPPATPAAPPPGAGEGPYVAGTNCAGETAAQVANYILADLRAVFGKATLGQKLCDDISNAIIGALKEASEAQRRSLAAEVERLKAALELNSHKVKAFDEAVAFDGARSCFAEVERLQASLTAANEKLRASSKRLFSAQSLVLRYGEHLAAMIRVCELLDDYFLGGGRPPNYDLAGIRALANAAANDAREVMQSKEDAAARAALAQPRTERGKA